MWMDLLLTILQWEAVLWLLLGISIPLSWVLSDECDARYFAFMSKHEDTYPLREVRWRRRALLFEAWGQDGGLGKILFIVAHLIFCVTTLSFAFLCIFFPPHWP